MCGDLLCFWRSRMASASDWGMVILRQWCFFGFQF
jgi:hypothetical protein